MQILIHHQGQTYAAFSPLPASVADRLSPPPGPRPATAHQTAKQSRQQSADRATKPRPCAPCAANGSQQRSNGAPPAIAASDVSERPPSGATGSENGTRPPVVPLNRGS